MSPIKVLHKEHELILNPIRLNWHYVVWYNNFFLTSVALVLPIILLSYWNYHTCKVVLSRVPSNGTNIAENTRPLNHSTAAELLNRNRTDTFERGNVIFILLY